MTDLMTDLPRTETKHGHLVHWYGDCQDGIEVRFNTENPADGVDEILLYRDGDLCLHIEQMASEYYWMSIQSRRFEVHAHIGSVSGRAEVGFTGSVEGWPREERDGSPDSPDSPDSVQVCPCNGCKMIKEGSQWWCPHMEDSDSVDVERHIRWQEANDLPEYLCKYTRREQPA